MCYGSSMANTDDIVTYKIAVAWRHHSSAEPPPGSEARRSRTMTCHEEFTIPAANLAPELRAVIADLVGHDLLSLAVTGDEVPF